MESRPAGPGPSSSSRASTWPGCAPHPAPRALPAPFSPSRTGAHAEVLVAGPWHPTEWGTHGEELLQSQGGWGTRRGEAALTVPVALSLATATPCQSQSWDSCLRRGLCGSSCHHLPADHTGLPPLPRQANHAGTCTCSWVPARPASHPPHLLGALARGSRPPSLAFLT